MSRLENKVAIVTGGSSGIGSAVAKLFAKEGAKVTIADIQQPMGQAVVDEIKESGGEAIFIKVDVSNSSQVQKMINHVVSVHGSIDILHCSAGILIPGSIEDLTQTEWERTLSVNLTGSFLCAKFALPAFTKAGGTIIFTSSTAGINGSKGIAAYSASKGALIALTKQMAIEYAESNIRVNTLCPGWIDTPFNDAYISSTSLTPQSINSFIPIGRQGTPNDAAEAVLFLASEASSYITGLVLLVDGGIAAKE